MCERSPGEPQGQLGGRKRWEGSEWQARKPSLFMEGELGTHWGLGFMLFLG